MVIEPGSEVEFGFAQSREAWGMSNVVFFEGGELALGDCCKVKNSPSGGGGGGVVGGSAGAQVFSLLRGFLIDCVRGREKRRRNS